MVERPHTPDTLVFELADGSLPVLDSVSHALTKYSRLGHSAVLFTLDIYSHVVPGLQEAAALKFDEVLRRDEGQVPELVS